MKVLHVIPTLEQGGAERLLADLCDHTSDSTEHVIVTLFGNVFFKPRRAAVYTIGFPRQVSTGGIRQVLRALWRLRRTVAAHKPDIVHCWLYYGNVLSLLLVGVAPKIIWSIHNTTLPKNRPVLQCAHWLSRLISESIPDRIVYCAATARELHEDYGYSAAASLVIPNGICIATFRPREECRQDIRASYGLKVDQVVIGIIGRLDLQKNVGLIAAAVARARSRLGAFKLLFAGRGADPENATLAELLTSFGLLDDSILLGEVSGVERYINAADIIALGSSYGEALPMILIEAAVCEKAIVATRLGDINALGLPADSIVPPEVEPFAEALVREARAWRDGSRVLTRAHIARTLSDTLSIDKCAKAYEQVYRSL